MTAKQEGQMKRILILMFTITMAALAVAQDKPRVFISGRGSQNMTASGNSGGNRWFRTGSVRATMDEHDESMEVAKDLQRGCSGVTITVNQPSADYTVMLTRESKQNRGLLRTNSQVQVVNRIGDVLDTHATRTVNNAAKDACGLILADWSQHGRLDAPAPAQTTPAPAPVGSMAEAAGSVNDPAPTQMSPMFRQPDATRTFQQPAAVPVVVPVVQESLGEAAKRNQQHKACLVLAADNPSITCQ
jgi:hypothetical protein